MHAQAIFTRATDRRGTLGQPDECEVIYLYSILIRCHIRSNDLGGRKRKFRKVRFYWVGSCNVCQILRGQVLEVLRVYQCIFTNITLQFTLLYLTPFMFSHTPESTISNESRSNTAT